MKSEDLVRTIAHELGHGAFGFEHTFDPEYGIDDRYNNLMGYGKGDTARLFKFQWDIAHEKASEDEFEDAEDVMEKFSKLGQGGGKRYYFDKNFKESKKKIVRDGSVTYHIPIADKIENDNYYPINRYFFKIGESVGIDKEQIFDDEGNLIPTPDYIEINSPMTIQGGDGRQGYEKVDFFNQTLAKKLAVEWMERNGWRPGSIFGNAARMKILIRSSLGRGELDFKHVMNLDELTIYEIHGIYYNRNEAGNWAYGYALASIGFSYNWARLISDFGTTLTDVNASYRNDVTLTEAYEISRKFDEPWERDAVLDGFLEYLNEKGAVRENNPYLPENINMYEFK